MSGGTSPSVDSSSPSPSCHGDQRNAANEGQRLKHTRRPRASREEVERPGSLTFQSSQGSPQMSETMSDVISDAKLVSLNEGRTPRSSVDYDQLLSKAAALLKEKNEREEEVATLRARNDSLLELNRTIREKSVRLHAKAEQEEEFISNMLLKRIQKLKNDKEAIALKYEQEEEFLTNDLTRKLSQLQNERDELAGRAKAEQSCVVDTLLVKIRKLEAEINANHVALEQLRREKVDLENALEHEQEQLFNTLGKRMDQLEAEKRRMQARLDQASVSEDQSPASSNSEVFGCAHEDNGERRSSRAEIEARKLREECSRLRAVIATQKSTITNLQQQMNAQESKYVAGLLAVREKSAETRADIRRARISLEGNLTKCLDACRAFANSQTARESDEDKRIDVLLSRISVPKSGTPTLIPTANNPVIATLSRC
uniref:Coiled-coil domain-containing protein 6 n=1 Tax=Ascaris suum TaxID=6253 RepID=F1KX59_ASCSU